MEYLLQLLGTFTISALTAFGLIKYFSQRMFESYLQQRIETHKSELARLNISHQIQFSSLHKERAELIKILYYSLYNCKLAILTFFNSELDTQDPKAHLTHMSKQWADSVRLFNTTSNRHRIFFSTKQAELMNNLSDRMLKISDSTKTFLTSFNSPQSQVNAIKKRVPGFQKLKQESDKLLTEVTILEKQLETEFRELLGVDIND